MSATFRDDDISDDLNVTSGAVASRRVCVGLCVTGDHIVGQ